MNNLKNVQSAMVRAAGLMRATLLTVCAKLAKALGKLRRNVRLLLSNLLRLRVPMFERYAMRVDRSTGMVVGLWYGGPSPRPWGFPPDSDDVIMIEIDKSTHQRLHPFNWKGMRIKTIVTK